MTASTPRRSTTGALALAALGVVYGDIGTSPLYAVKETFSPSTGAVPLSPENVVGATSALFWLIMLVVSLKYVTLVLRADNRGEGGVMALLALVRDTMASRPRLQHALVVLGIFGACLFYGDSVLTPAISVMSAVEGIGVVAPGLERWVLPVSLGVLAGLFLLQRRGTAAVGRWFGPAVVVWFVMLALVGAWQVAQAPQILLALDPRQALAFMLARGPGVFLAVGALVLAVTGAEALYADMGHFGRRAIRLAWTGLVLPALALNYLGQGALLLRVPEAVANPFYRMFPEPLLAPAVAVATVATVIASQAVISGAYSLTRQAIQLGYLPRMRILHTSASEQGQIYIPAVNWLLLGAVMLTCVGFGSSSAMAAAYGIAVTLTMLITTVLTYFVVRYRWGMPGWLATIATVGFLLLDALLVAACLTKFMHGGWFPVALALVVLVLMLTWSRGRDLLLLGMRDSQPELAAFAPLLAADAGLARVPRTAVYLAAEPGIVPQAWLHNLKHNGVLHARNLVVTVRFHDAPVVAPAQRIEVVQVSAGAWQVVLHFGFMERPDVPAALEGLAGHGIAIDPFATSYFLSRETVVPAATSGMVRWRQRLFGAMSRNAGRAADFFRIPHNAVIELGTRVQV